MSNQHALKIFINYHADDRNVVRIYRKVSDIYLNQNNYEVAVIYEEQVDKIHLHHRQRFELDSEAPLKYSV
jgi:hypothetical protein